MKPKYEVGDRVRFVGGKGLHKDWEKYIGLTGKATAIGAFTVLIKLDAPAVFGRESIGLLHNFVQKIRKPTQRVDLTFQ